MIFCRHCSAEATLTDENDVEGASLKCATCAIPGKIVQLDADSEGEAVAYLAFSPNDGERCNLDDCDECEEERKALIDEERADRWRDHCEGIGVLP